MSTGPQNPDVNPPHPLVNPQERMDIRPDFPDLAVYRPDDDAAAQKILQVIRQELAKQGTTLEEAGRITIAYPHKHPDLFPGHKNRGADHAAQFKKLMQKAAPGIEWITADGLVETRRLNRSKDQTAVHALTQRQHYEMHEPSQAVRLPFTDAANRKKEFFVIVDDAIIQGTTVANLMNFIEHNGGKVLMASARESNDGTPIAQKQLEGGGISGHFSDKTSNTGRLPQLAKAFAASARADGQDWTEKECIEKLDAALHKNGMSVRALTDGECNTLLQTLEGKGEAGPALSFPRLLGQLLR